MKSDGHFAALGPARKPQNSTSLNSSCVGVGDGGLRKGHSGGRQERAAVQFILRHCRAVQCSRAPHLPNTDVLLVVTPPPRTAPSTPCFYLQHMPRLARGMAYRLRAVRWDSANIIRR